LGVLILLSNEEVKKILQSCGLCYYISLIFSIAIAFFLGEYLEIGFISKFFPYTTDSISEILSMIYGFGRIYFWILLMKTDEKLHELPFLF